MNAKKIISVVLALCLCFSMFAVAFAVSAEDNTGKLRFHEDGTFKILMINDTQDDQKLNSKTASFLKKAIKDQNPDLIVVAGDVLSDLWPGVNESKLEQGLKEVCQIFNDAKVPFAITPGNHDHDRIDDCSSVQHFMDVCTSFPYHVSTADGCDPGTYSVPIYSNDGSKVEYVVYMVDSNNKGEALSIIGYSGCTQSQIQWLRDTAAAYKTANGGADVPSTVVQHVPVAEIYNLLTKVTDKAEYLDKGVVFSSNDKNWYRLNKTDYPDMQGSLGEAPCSEAVSTGEYQAMVDIGVVSAFFAHDHVNTFGATTKEGVFLCYNGGSGFNAYGHGSKRSVRYINLNEKDLTKVDTGVKTYEELTGSSFSYYYTDFMTTELATIGMKMVMLIPSLIAKMFK